jgi:WD40 repeat protein
MGHTLAIQALAFSADGATLTSTACTVSAPPTGVEVAVWDVRTGTRVAQHHAFPGGLRAPTLAPGGRRLAATVDNRDMVLWDVAPWRERVRLAVPALLGSIIAFSDDAAQLATTDFQDGISLWDTDNGRLLSSCKVQYVSSLAFAPGGAMLACSTTDRNVWLWNPATGEEIGVLRGHERTAFALAFSPDGCLLASSDFGGTVKLWDVATRTLRATFTEAGGEADALVFSPDGRTLAVTLDRAIQLWDVATAKRGARLEGHQKKVRCLAFSPDGQMLASGSYDQTVRLWDMARFRPTEP